MAHTITLTTPSITWDEFIASRDISVLADYPECSGKTLDQVTEEGVQSQIEHDVFRDNERRNPSVPRIALLSYAWVRLER